MNPTTVNGLSGAPWITLAYLLSKTAGSIEWPETCDEFRQDIVDRHLNSCAWKRNEKNEYGDLITKFLAARPDGIAFNAEGKECRFLEFMRPMDAQQSIPKTGLRRKILPKTCATRTIDHY